MRVSQFRSCDSVSLFSFFVPFLFSLGTPVKGEKRKRSKIVVIKPLNLGSREEEMSIKQKK